MTESLFHVSDRVSFSETNPVTPLIHGLNIIYPAFKHIHTCLMNLQSVCTHLNYEELQALKQILPWLIKGDVSFSTPYYKLTRIISSAIPSDYARGSNITHFIKLINKCLLYTMRREKLLNKGTYVFQCKYRCHVAMYRGWLTVMPYS